MADHTLYVVDQIVLEPGEAEAFVDAYLTRYVPTATARGLTLDRVTVSPPVWLDDASNTVTATWTVTGTASWWGAAVAGRHDPGPARWWESMAPVIVERSRSMAAAAADVDELCNV